MRSFWWVTKFFWDCTLSSSLPSVTAPRKIKSMNSPSWESTLDSNYLNTEIIQAPLSPPIWETPLWEGTVLYRNSIFEWLYLFKSSGDRLSRGNVSLCSGWSIPFCWRIHFLLTWEKFVKHSATIFSASIFSTRKQKGSLEDRNTPRAPGAWQTQGAGPEKWGSHTEPSPSGDESQRLLT